MNLPPWRSSPQAEQAARGIKEAPLRPTSLAKERFGVVRRPGPILRGHRLHLFPENRDAFDAIKGSFWNLCGSTAVGVAFGVGTSETHPNPCLSAHGGNLSRRERRPPSENDRIGSRWLRVSRLQGTWTPTKNCPFRNVSGATARRALQRACMVSPLRLEASPSENATTGTQRCTSVAVLTPCQIGMRDGMGAGRLFLIDNYKCD